MTKYKLQFFDGQNWQDIAPFFKIFYPEMPQAFDTREEADLLCNGLIEDFPACNGALRVVAFKCQGKDFIPNDMTLSEE